MKIKGIIVFLGIVFLSSPCFAFFKDIPKTHRAYPAVQKLLKTGIIQLPSDRKFNGKKKVDMYQFAFILDRILEYTGKRKGIEARPLENFYNDISKDHYAYKAAKDMVKMGLFVVPFSKKFKGRIKINRYTFYSYFAAFLERIENKKLPAAPADSGFYDVSTDNPAYVYLQKLIGAGILTGKRNFKGEQLANRYEMAIFVARILDYYLPEGEEVKIQEEPVFGYRDIAKDHYARQAIDELVEAGILPAGEGRLFYGDTMINRYLLIDFISKIIEKIAAGEVGELSLASPSQAYKDVPVSHYAYRSVQKLIARGIIPPGDRRELFYGDRKISRYQMAYFVFSAIEHALSDVLTFKSAPDASGYGDVPPDYFVHDTIQKLIWLGVLKGGEANKFDGDEYVDRYELCFFTVNLIKAIFLKLEEIEEVVYEEPVEYGFNAYLRTNLTGTQYSTNEAFGDSYSDLSASQAVSVYIDTSVSEVLSVFASFTSNYTFGDATLSYPYLEQGYIMFDNPPFVFQLGRTSFYQGFTPFGNSIFIDTSSDIILVNYDHHLFNLNSIIGKFVYFGDITLDSNFGSISLTPKLAPFLGWLEFSLGGSLITDLPEPGFSYTLPTSVAQIYTGLKMNLINLFELSVETAKLNFSNSSVLSTVGYSSKDDFEARQYALTYYSEDYGYSLSLGYQQIGDDYYLSNLADPTVFANTEQNTESLLFRTTYYPSSSQTIGADLAYITRDGYNFKSTVSGYYNREVFDEAYLNLSMTKIMDNTLAKQDQFNLSSSFSVTF